MLTGRARLVVLGALVVIVLLVAWVVGSQGASTPSRTAGSVRLGPDPGQPVAGYLAELPRQLPPPGPATLALVQTRTALDVRAAAALAGPTPVLTAVFRVPMPRVQTALRFEPVTGTGDLAGALQVARERAGYAATADATTRTGRPRAVAAAEQRAYADPACPCVLALVVRADRARLAALAADPSVRAVQAAPVGSEPPDLALSPLLPEQVTAADPLPDDGPVSAP